MKEKKIGYKVIEERSESDNLSVINPYNRLWIINLYSLQFEI